MTITYRATKGSALTWTELDNNFVDLNGRVGALEGTASNPIDSISVVGNVLTVTYTTAFGGGSDSNVIPVAAWNFTGLFQHDHEYLEMDVFSQGTGLYLVKIDHTSDATFDPGKQISAQNVYQTLLSANVGTSTTETLEDATYTLQVLDGLKYFRCTDTTGCEITIPPFDSVALRINTEIHFRQCADNLTFITDTNVTLNVPEGKEASTDHVGAVVTLKKVDTDEWDIFGALHATTA